MTFEILIHREAAKILKNLDEKTQKRIKEKLKTLKENPYEGAKVDIKKIRGTDPVLYRLRIGDYRVVYAIEDNIIWITEIFHRSKGYV